MEVNKSKLGKKSRKKGTNNQAKSKQYILKHPEIYGIDVDSINKSGTLQSNRVHSMINSAFPTPFKDLFAMWDIITMPIHANDMNSIPDGRVDINVEGKGTFGIMTVIPNEQCIYLVQVKSKSITQEYLNTLAAFETPFYVKKEIHVWNDNDAEPTIYKL